MDKRHLRRQTIVQQLYASAFRDDSIDDGLDKTKQEEKTKAVLEHSEEIDKHIVEYAKKYEIDKIAKVDLAILRLATYELLIEGKVPPKVVINEAVELAALSEHTAVGVVAAATVAAAAVTGTHDGLRRHEGVRVLQRF